MHVQVIVSCARSLKNVNWRYGMLHPYAVVWIDTSGKCSTKIDMHNNMNPVWNEKFTIPLPPTSFIETAILHIDIVHANAPPGTKPRVGSVRFPLYAALNEARANGKVSSCLNLLRPSGRPQGTVEIMIGVKDPNIGQVNQFNQQAPYNQHPTIQPRPQAQYQPQPQGQFQPKPQMQPQVQFQPRPQGQIQPHPAVRPQGPQQQVKPQGQTQPRPVVQPQGLYPSQQQVKPQGQLQPRPRPQPQPQYMQPQVQPINQYPNKPAPVRPVVYQPNSKPTPGQRPMYSMPAATNQPAYRPAKPVPGQNQNNPATGMGTGQEATRLNRDMLIQQNQNVQSAYNSNSNGNGTPAATGTNNNGQAQSAPSAADNGTDNSKEVSAQETYAGETSNDAESIQLSYEETPCESESVGCNNGGYGNSEYATEEYNNGGYGENPGVECDNGGYDMNSGVEYDNGAYDMNAGAGCGNEGYDMNAGVGCDNGGYGMNAGVGCDNEGYDMNAGMGYDNGGYDMNGVVECDNGVYENGDYVDEQYCDGAFDGAGLDSQVNCGEVEVSEY